MRIRLWRAAECFGQVSLVKLKIISLAMSPRRRISGPLLADRLAGDDVDDDLRAVWRRRPRFGPAVLGSGPVLRAAWMIDRISDRFNRR